IVVADAQALMREIGPKGEVLLRAPQGLECIDYLKASRSEAALLDLDALRKRLHVIVTDGPRGCTLLTERTETHVPAFEANEIDPTGAGDCFLAGFAFGLARGLDAKRAARIGAHSGARAVEHIGVPPLQAFSNSAGYG